VKLNLVLKQNHITIDMVFIRKVTRGSKKRFDYSVNLPREIVEKLNLIDSTVKLTVKNGTIIITKIEDESAETIHKIDSKDEIF